MPAQKRLQENADEDLRIESGGEHQEGSGEDEDEEETEAEEHQPDQDSDRSLSSNSGGAKEEFIFVKLIDVRKEVQCPICLGIIRKTRTVMECLHRFCRECIDKSMRLGNKECPACRTHCPSRRSLRDDPNYDALIAALYPDIDQYEEEELAFQEEEDARNKQIQASIAQTFQRQSAALSKKRKRSRSTMRRRANHRSDDDDDEANGNSSSADERPETRPKRPRRGRDQGSPSVANGGVHGENESEANRDTPASGGLLGTPEMLAWGRGGTRSHTRHGSAGGGNSKQSRRVARLMEYFQNLEKCEEMDINVIIVPLDGDKTQRLKHSYLCCSPSLSIRQICQFITAETTLQADELEILAVKELHSKINALMSLDVLPSNAPILDLCKDEMLLLDFEQTLREVRLTVIPRQGYVILTYRRKCLQPGDGSEGTSTALGGDLNEAGTKIALDSELNQAGTSTVVGGEPNQAS